MKIFQLILVSALAIVALIGCADTETPVQNREVNDGNSAQDRSQLAPTEQPESTSDDTQAQPELSPKEQYVVDARQLVDKIFEIVDTVSDSASAAKAVEECTKLKPVAEKLSGTARELMEVHRDDPTGRAGLREYFRSKLHSDADLQPLVAKLGESEKDSEYPQLYRIVVELIETSMHNHF